MEIIEKTVSDRIMAAAEELYAQNGRAAFPLVDDVRRAAKANMNEVVRVMKTWRGQKLAQAIPVAIEVPAAIEQVSRTALVALWQAAQEQASGSLRSAQMAWDAERMESDAVNAQTAAAYEAKATALEAVQADMAQLQAKAEEATRGRLVLQGEHEALQAKLAADQTRAAQEAKQAEEEHGREIARLLALVDAERARVEAAQEAAHLVNGQHAAEVARLSAALEQARERHAEEVSQQRGELLEQSTNAHKAQEKLRSEIAAANALAETARQQQDLVQESARESIEAAQTEASQAREGAAQLRGQVEALKTQTDGLMHLLAERLATRADAEAIGPTLITAVDLDPTRPA